MNTEIKSIGLGVAGAMVVRGFGGVFPATASPKLVHGSLALASGLGAWKVKNPNLKSAFIGGALIKSVDFVKALFEGTATATSLQVKTDKASLFLKSATGLGCPMDGLNGEFEDESYLLGSEDVYLDEAGNVIGLGFADDSEYEMLNGEYEEEASLLGAENEIDLL